MARTKQAARKSKFIPKGELEWRAEAAAQITSWRAERSAAPAQEGLLARLRARFFHGQPSPRPEAPPFDILAELPNDARAVVFGLTDPQALARLALASKPWCSLIAHSLPSLAPSRRHEAHFNTGLALIVRAVASRMHPVELVELLRAVFHQTRCTRVQIGSLSH